MKANSSFVRYALLLLLIPWVILAFIVITTGTLVRITGWLLVGDVDSVVEELQTFGFSNLKI